MNAPIGIVLAIEPRANGWAISIQGLRQPVLYLVSEGGSWRPARAPGSQLARALAPLVGKAGARWRFGSPEAACEAVSRFLRQGPPITAPLGAGTGSLL